MKKEILDQLVKWAIKIGFSTGHSSTIKELLDELEWQIDDLKKGHSDLLSELEKENHKLKSAVINHQVRFKFPSELSYVYLTDNKRAGFGQFEKRHEIACQRTARLQALWSWVQELNRQTGIEPPQEMFEWFDEDGVPL